MKKKKANKRKKKKDEKNEEEIQPARHENVGNVNCFSEEIAREIINKLISLTFTNLYMKKMNKIIDNYYVRNLLCQINNLVEISFINHELDINIQEDDDIKNKSFIIEPKKKVIERRIQEKKIYNKNNININKSQNNNDSFTKKTFIEELDINYLKNKDLLYDAKISNKNFWDTIPEPHNFSFERTSTYKNVIKQAQETNFLEVSKTPQENNNKKKYTKLKSKYNYFVSKKIEDIYQKKKKNYIKKNEDLPSEKIPDEVLGIMKEEEDIKNMRKKLLEEIEKKNLEEKREKERKRLEEIAKRNKDNNKKSKDKNNEDNILNPDLFIKEFISISTNQKEIKAGSPLSLLKEEKKEQTKKAKKNIEYNIVQRIKPEKEMLLQKKLQQKLLFKKYKLKNKEKEKEKEKDESNTEDDDEEPPGNLKPSGSNFALIKPEVGVIIQENTKVKSGGINFYEKYNKFSINDFNKTMTSIYDRNFSNLINNIDSNTFTSGKININNNTMTTFKKKDLSNNKKENKIIEVSKEKEELSEKNLFKKTFMNRLTNLKKKFMYKSQSEICLSNKCNSNIFREALSTNEKSYYYYSNNLFDSNKSKNEFNKNFELTYIGRRKSKFNQLVNNKFFSPIPTNLLNTYKNTLLKNYFYNADKNDSFHNINTSRETNKKFNLMDNFNKNILEGNDKFNDILYKKMMKSTKNNFLPKIKYSESLFINKKGNRTKNYFFRTRFKDKKNNENNK